MKNKVVADYEGYMDLLTMDDCAGILQQSTQTVRRLCRERVLPSVKIGRRIYVPRNRFAEFVKSQLEA